MQYFFFYSLTQNAISKYIPGHIEMKALTLAIYEQKYHYSEQQEVISQEKQEIKIYFDSMQLPKLKKVAAEDLLTRDAFYVDRSM